MYKQTATPVQSAHPWRWAILWGAVLGVIFFSTYNNVNRYTATLEPVDSFFFAWETQIPFLPWTIVPYWSIDVFYGLALFLATTKTALFRLVKRLLLAQVLCISGFLLFPLKFAFVRPATEGLFGNMFAALAQFDLPYNQAPSLHIVLLLVLWRHYRVCTENTGWRYLVDAWCCLIALSVLTTWQHHFIDLITGLWVGAFCLLAIPEQPGNWSFNPAHLARRHRLAAYYAVGAILFGVVAGVLWPGISAAIFWWISIALAYVALVYCFGCPAHLGKQLNGHIPWSLYIFLAPYYVGARINAWYHLRSRAHYSEIVPGVYLGALSAKPLVDAQLTSQHLKPLAGVIDLTAELESPSSGKNSGYTYHLLPSLDLLPLNTSQLQIAAAAIEQSLQVGSVFVACALGVSRSSAVVAAWLVCHRAYSVDEAIALVQQQRPCVIISPAQRDELQRLSAR